MAADIIKYALIGVFVSSTAHAFPVEWSLDGLIRADGGTVSGSFVYDADTDSYSSVNVTTTQDSSTLPGESYAGFDQASSDENGVVLVRTQGAADVTGQNNILIAFSPPGLTNAGGVVTTVLAEEVSCTNADCSTSDPTNAQALTGDVVGTPVPPPMPGPTPATPTPVPVFPLPVLGLLVAILAGVGVRRLRRS